MFPDMLEGSGGDQNLNLRDTASAEAVIKTIPKKKNVKRPNGILTRSYKQLRNEEKLKAKEKRKDIPI